jgi:hypothetical protein
VGRDRAALPPARAPDELLLESQPETVRAALADLARAIDQTLRNERLTSSSSKT